MSDAGFLFSLNLWFEFGFSVYCPFYGLKLNQLSVKLNRFPSFSLAIFAMNGWISLELFCVCSCEIFFFNCLDLSSQICIFASLVERLCFVLVILIKLTAEHLEVTTVHTFDGFVESLHSTFGAPSG